MTPTTKRLRGALIRLAMNRWRGIAAGVVLATPAVLLVLQDYPWEAWYTDALSLVFGGTGAAFLLVALGGRRPDWIEP